MRHLIFQAIVEGSSPKIQKGVFLYYIAGQKYQSQRKIEWLEHLNHESMLVNESTQVLPSKFHQDKQDVIYHGKVLIGENSYFAHVFNFQGSTYGFKFDSQEYIVDKNNISINSFDVDPVILLGPVLITNLAQNKVFCVHASAFILNDKAFVLMGDSGTGKSTIAKFIGSQKQCRRLADDMLPVGWINNKLSLFPQFPQLKLKKNDQYIGDNITKETIFLFAKKSNKNTQVKPIDRFSAIKKLIKHSVATKLFAKKELKNHLEFCHQASSEVKSYDVNYQHSEQAIRQLIEQLNDI